MTKTLLQFQHRPKKIAVRKGHRSDLVQNVNCRPPLEASRLSRIAERPEVILDRRTWHNSLNLLFGQRILAQALREVLKDLND